MKTPATVLILLALLALVPCAQCLAQAPSAVTPSATSTMTPPAPASVAEFLDTLSKSDTPGAGDQAPTSKPMATICTTNADCPTGQLCCYPCGIDGCSKTCMQPLRGHCPFFP